MERHHPLDRKCPVQSTAEWSLEGYQLQPPPWLLGGSSAWGGGADQDNLTDSHQLGDGPHLTPLEAAIRAQFKEMLGWLFPGQM